MSGGSFPQVFKVKRGRRREAALNDHALPAAGVIVARSAVNVVALAAPLQILARHGERKFVRHHAVLFAGIKQFIGVEMPTRYRAGNHRPFGTAIIEEGAGFVGKIFRLNVHVKPAAGQQHSDTAEASESSHTEPYAADTRASAPVSAVMKIKLQFRTLREDANFPKNPSFEPNRISCRAPSRKERNGLSMRAQILLR